MMMAKLWAKLESYLHVHHILVHHPSMNLSIPVKREIKVMESDAGTIVVPDDDDGWSDPPTSSFQWLVHGNIVLLKNEKDTITSGGWLTNKHMDFAQTLLKDQHSSISGLLSTLVLSR